MTMRVRVVSLALAAVGAALVLAGCHKSTADVKSDTTPTGAMATGVDKAATPGGGGGATATNKAQQTPPPAAD